MSFKSFMSFTMRRITIHTAVRMVQLIKNLKGLADVYPRTHWAMNIIMQFTLVRVPNIVWKEFEKLSLATSQYIPAVSLS